VYDQRGCDALFSLRVWGLQQRSALRHARRSKAAWFEKPLDEAAELFLPGERREQLGTLAAFNEISADTVQLPCDSALIFEAAPLGGTHRFGG